MTEKTKALKKAIDADMLGKQEAKTGLRYYAYQHDILKNRIFYMNDEGKLVEDRYASNIKIAHTFFTELVDQKVQYLLSLPVRLDVEDVEFKAYLNEYYNEHMQLFLQEVVEGMSIKGYEYVYARTNGADMLQFQVSDYISTFTMHDTNGNEEAVVRYYDRMVKGKLVRFAEIWTDDNVKYFVADSRGEFGLDTSREMNPRPHVLAMGVGGEILRRSYGQIPFFKIANNKNGQTDLEPIKSIIDDYDIMNCFLSNNLQDMAEAIYVVKGFEGDNLDTLRTNIKAKKTVGVDTDGDVDIKTIDIPVEARRAKMDIDKTNIYKFGGGFDSSQVASSQGSVTNVAIQAGYELLNMKCNKAEIRLRTLIAWMNELIVQDINRRYGKSYDTSNIKVIINRETMTDKKEIAEIKKLEADTELVIIQKILSIAPVLDDETVLKLVCERLDIDYEEVKKLIAEQDYIPLDGDDDAEA